MRTLQRLLFPDYPLPGRWTDLRSCGFFMLLHQTVADCARKILEARLPLNADQRTTVSFIAQLPWHAERDSVPEWQHQVESLLPLLPPSMDTDLIAALYQWAVLMVEGKRSDATVARYYRNLRHQAVGCGVNFPALPEA